MESSPSADTSVPPPTQRRWVGVLLSFLVAGAGIFLAGNRKAGLRWFIGLTMLWVVMAGLAPAAVIPGLAAFVVLASCLAGLTLWMLVLSYKPVPKLGIRGWLLFLGLAGLLRALTAPIAHQFAWPFRMPTRSMEPTIQPGDHLFVQASAYWFGRPSRGDVVVFRTDALRSSGLPVGQFYMKRVVGLPGEALQIAKGSLLINGQPLQGPSVIAGQDFSMPPGNLPPVDTNAYIVPAACYFVVGDHVANSLDSRHFGAIPCRSIIGRATKIYWPKGRIGDIQ